MAASEETEFTPPATAEYSGAEIAKALQGTDPVAREAERRAMETEYNSRSGLKRTVDKVTGRDRRMRVELSDRSRAEAAAARAEVGAINDYDPALRRLHKAARALDGSSPETTSNELIRVHDGQKEVVLGLAALAREHGYMVSGTTSTGPEERDRFLGEEGIRSRGGYLMLAVDKRLVNSAEGASDPERGEGSRRLLRQTELLVQAERGIVNAMRATLTGEGSSQVFFPIEVGGTTVKSEDREHSAALLRALSAVRAMTGAEGVLNPPPSYGSGREDELRQMDPFSNFRMPGELSDKIGDDSLAGTKMRLPIGLDLEVEVSFYLEGRFNLEVVNGPGAARRPEVIESQAHIREVTRGNEAAMLETQSLWTQADWDQWSDEHQIGLP